MPFILQDNRAPRLIDRKNYICNKLNINTTFVVLETTYIKLNMLRSMLALLFFVFSHGLYGQPDTDKKVLFVGNSYTYFWNLPQLVQQMAEEKDFSIETRQSTIGGSNLGQHWRSERELRTREYITSGNFDVVVLQDHSRRALDAPDSLSHYITLLQEEINKSGGETFLYMTWSREWAPETQEAITKEYSDIGKAIGATVVPVGLAWAKARELDPDIVLYDPDGSHPNTVGTYLSACVFYGALTGDSPVGLPVRLITTDKNGEKLYLSIQSKDTALFCQQVAQSVLTAH